MLDSHTFDMAMISNLLQGFARGQTGAIAAFRFVAGAWTKRPIGKDKNLSFGRSIASHRCRRSCPRTDHAGKSRPAAFGSRLWMCWSEHFVLISSTHRMLISTPGYFDGRR